jgi:hypothetical protein
MTAATATRTRYFIQSRAQHGIRGWENRTATIQGEARALRILNDLATEAPGLNWRCVTGDGIYTGNFELIGNRPATQR